MYTSSIVDYYCCDGIYGAEVKQSGIGGEMKTRFRCLIL